MYSKLVGANWTQQHALTIGRYRDEKGKESKKTLILDPRPQRTVVLLATSSEPTATIRSIMSQRIFLGLKRANGNNDRKNHSYEYRYVGNGGVFRGAPEEPGSEGGSPGCMPGFAQLCVEPGCRRQTQIAPLAFSGDPDQAFATLKQIIGRRKDTAIIEESPDYLRVELRTVLFVDDGEFLLDRTRKVIHVRTASRIGYSDFGKNRSRLEEIRAQFMAASR